MGTEAAKCGSWQAHRIGKFVKLAWGTVVCKNLGKRVPSGICRHAEPLSADKGGQVGGVGRSGPLQLRQPFIEDLSEAHDELANRPDLIVEDGNVQTLRAALQAETAKDEFLTINTPRLVKVDEVEELAHLLDVQVQRAEVRGYIRLVHVLLQLRQADAPRIVAVQLVENLLHGLHELGLRALLRLDDKLAVILGALHCAVNEDCAEDIQHAEDAESHVAIEDAFVVEGQEPQGFQYVAPVGTPRDGHVERDDGTEECPELFSQIRCNLTLCEVFLQAINHGAISVKDPEHQEDNEQDHHGPDQRLQRAAERVDNDA
mmetsp:Transcript_79516/g.219938  ORF Transcript_79516/g.219938 Transcript_79516/m.219938 type:complete len:317 (+) Transcript_79516:73-1023(+)